MKNLYDTLKEISLPDEIWMPFKQCANIYYSVSNKGRFSSGTSINPKRHKGRGWKVKIISPYANKKGYMLVRTRENGITKHYQLHRIVLSIFSPCNNMEILQVNHIDGDKSNNNLNNLEWCTAQHNIQHSFDNGLQEPTNIILVGYDYVIAFAMYLNGFLYGEIVEHLGNKVKDRAVYQALKRKTYLRWYSEDDFKNKVDNLRKQLPVKKPYRTHNRLDLL